MTTNVPPETEVPDSDVPLVEIPETPDEPPEMEVPDPEVPLADLPDEPEIEIPDLEVPLGEPEIEIPDLDVPLADVPSPQTGVTGLNFGETMALLSLVCALGGSAVLTMARKKSSAVR